ncbi:uncharacterized protein TNCV_749081 [Trichonephila clavipes]|nr:uncharacterized protein TNCV_749081 [Trichonephila clavipes]
MSALFHCSSSVEKPMHGQCPIGKKSWCYYQRALSCGKKPNEKYKGLSNEVLNMIKPTYLELCTKELLTKCLHCKTQNSNECLNGVVWQRVPKEVFVCLKTLKSGALDAVIQFNDGYKGCVEIFKKLNITPGYFTLKAYKHLDINRINVAERHSTPNVKQRRKILTATRKKNQCFRECTDTLTFKKHIDYLAEKFWDRIHLAISLVGRRSPLSLENKVMLYKQVLRPVITYASPVWGAAATTHMKKIQLWAPRSAGVAGVYVTPLREGNQARKTGSGATRKTTRRENRRIVQQALVDPTVTRSKIRADVGVAIVPQTISRHLAEANLKSRRIFRALPLTQEHQQLRCDKSIRNFITNLLSRPF